MIPLALPALLTAQLTDVILDFSDGIGANANTFTDAGSWAIADLTNVGGGSSGASATLSYSSVDGSSWSVSTGGASLGINDGGYSWDSTLTQDYFQADGGMWTVDLTGLTTGQEYTVSFYGGRDAYGYALRLMDCEVTMDGTTVSDVMQTTRNGIPNQYSTWPLDVAEVSITAGATGTATITMESPVSAEGVFPSGWWDANYNTGTTPQFTQTDMQSHINLIQITAVAVPEPASIASLLGFLVFGTLAVRRRRA